MPDQMTQFAILSGFRVVASKGVHAARPGVHVRRGLTGAFGSAVDIGFIRPIRPRQAETLDEEVIALRVKMLGAQMSVNQSNRVRVHQGSGARAGQPMQSRFWQGGFQGGVTGGAGEDQIPCAVALTTLEQGGQVLAVDLRQSRCGAGHGVDDHRHAGDQVNTDEGANHAVLHEDTTR